MRDSLEFRRRIDDLKRSISLSGMIESDGNKITRSGGLDKCCCPFHREKTPSFVIYEDNHYHCFGCHAHGDIFHYVMKRDGCDFMGAVERLSNGSLKSERMPVRKFTVVKKEPELPKDYFEKMMNSFSGPNACVDTVNKAFTIGLCATSICDLGAGWSSERNAWAFPMCDGFGNIIGIRYRSFTGEKWAEKRSKQGLFIPVTKPEPDLYVTEGPTDCAAMLSMGLFAIGKASAMQGPEEIVKFIQKHRIRRVIVIADNDTAGLNGAKKLIAACPVPCCELVLPAKDAREFYRNGGTRELIESLLKQCVWRNPK